MPTITVQCDCGQHFEFDVESSAPLTEPIACPACGADGTNRANTAIAQQTASKPAATPALRVNTPTYSAQTVAAARGMTRLPGQIDPSQATHEARAKILWGDTPEQVVHYLMVQGFTRDDATELVDELHRERMATVRGKGLVNIGAGALLITVPILVWISFMVTGRLYVSIFALTCAGGLFGLWLLVNGIQMVIAPKSKSGDAGESDLPDS